MDKKYKRILCVCLSLMVIGASVFCLVLWNPFDTSQSLRKWFSKLDYQDASVKVRCNSMELKEEDEKEFINILKNLSRKELKKSSTGDETTQSYNFYITDGKTTYRIIDQVSYAGKAYIREEGKSGGWYIKNNVIREFMDKIYDEYSKSAGNMKEMDFSNTDKISIWVANEEKFTERQELIRKLFNDNCEYSPLKDYEKEVQVEGGILFTAYNGDNKVCWINVQQDNIVGIKWVGNEEMEYYEVSNPPDYQEIEEEIRKENDL